jgi:hypothetical protein
MKALVKTTTTTNNKSSCENNTHKTNKHIYLKSVRFRLLCNIVNISFFVITRSNTLHRIIVFNLDRITCRIILIAIAIAIVVAKIERCGVQIFLVTDLLFERCHRIAGRRRRRSLRALSCRMFHI